MMAMSGIIVVLGGIFCIGAILAIIIALIVNRKR
jgi:hypothetical protein